MPYPTCSFHVCLAFGLQVAMTAGCDTAESTPKFLTSDPAVDTSGDTSQAAENDMVFSTIGAYVAAWNARDRNERAELLQQAWADAGTYVDPTLAASGRTELSDAIGSFLDALPRAQLSIISEIDAHHRVARFAWNLDGTKFDGPGMDYAEVDDDKRLVRIVGFFDTLPKTAEPPQSVVDYLSAWNASVATEREPLLESSVTDDVELVAPNIELSGRTALAAYLSEVRQEAPDLHVTISPGISRTTTALRIRRHLANTGRPDRVEMDIVELNASGQIARIVTFSGDLVPAP